MSATESTKRELKHLGFVMTAAIQTVVLVSSLYDYVKRNAGPLRSVVGSVESTAKSVVGPVLVKYKNLPVDVFVFADQKVDEMMQKFGQHAPLVATEVAHSSCMLLGAAAVAAELGRRLLSEVETGGPVAGLHYAVSEFKHASISLIAMTYVAVDEFKLFHKLADLVVPTAAQWSEKYNKLVISLSRKGHKIFSYFPQIPTDEISQACNKQKASKVAQNVSTERPSSSSSDSD